MDNVKQRECDRRIKTRYLLPHLIAVGSVKIGQTAAVAGGISLLPTSVRLAMAQSMTISHSDIGFNGGSG
ncbi:hypothetical protein OH492_12010 [Vibrio chagasii]|nr:hypothetical protein [Vibrio chagasii]